jgi:hypothetical protein
MLFKYGALDALLHVAFHTTQASVRVIALHSVLALAKSAKAKSTLLGKGEASAGMNRIDVIAPAIHLVWCLTAAAVSPTGLPTSEADQDGRCKLIAARCLAQLSWGEESGSIMALIPELVKGLVQVTMPPRSPHPHHSLIRIFSARQACGTNAESEPATMDLAWGEAASREAWQAPTLEGEEHAVAPIAETAALALARIARYVPEAILDSTEIFEPLLRALEMARSPLLQYRLLATIQMLERWPSVSMQLAGGRMDRVLQRCLRSEDKNVSKFAQQLLTLTRPS